MESDHHHLKIGNLLLKFNCLKAIGRKKPEKCHGFNGIRTRDLRDTGEMLDQLSCEAAHRERGQFVEVIPSRAVNYIYEIHIVLRLLMKVKSDHHSKSPI